MAWWDATVDQAIALQRELAPRVETTNGFDLEKLRVIAGVDASYRDLSKAAVVVLSFPDFQVLDQAIAIRRLAVS